MLQRRADLLNELVPRLEVCEAGVLTQVALHPLGEMAQRVDLHLALGGDFEE